MKFNALRKLMGLMAGLVAFFASGATVFGQVQNDNIEHRKKLSAEEIWVSSTEGCTVQSACVDEMLTGKCVEYHNDQWFEFTPTVSGRYFVNVSGQQCRDIRGVQLVMLTGKPCEVQTYTILSCTSLGTQDDVFVSFDFLKAGKTYLLNIDGYLHDQCRFTVQVSREPKGMPAFIAPPIPAGNISDKIVKLNWTLPDTLKAQHFKILRRETKAFKTTEIGEIAVVRDSYGHLVSDYNFTDTLAIAGNYFYQVVAYGAEMPVMLLQQWQILPQISQLPVWLNLPLDKYRNGAKLTILVTEPVSGRVLRIGQIIRKKKDEAQSKLLLNDWQQQNIRKILVRITWQKGAGKAESTETLVTIPEPD